MLVRNVLMVGGLAILMALPSGLSVAQSQQDRKSGSGAAAGQEQAAEGAMGGMTAGTIAVGVAVAAAIAVAVVAVTGDDDAVSTTTSTSTSTATSTN